MPLCFSRDCTIIAITPSEMTGRLCTCAIQIQGPAVRECVMNQSSIDTRQINRQNLLSYVYTQHDTTQKSIKDTLQLSRSTIVPILKELEEQGFIRKGDVLESTGGRPATNISFHANRKIALGVELLAEHYEITALNLYGETLKCVRVPVLYRNEEDYYAQVCASVEEVAAAVSTEPDHILGVGVVLQGLISTDGRQVTYGKILGCTGLTVDTFSARLPYPCLLFHDAEAATIDELWQSPQLTNAIYVHIRNNMSASIIVDRKSLLGTELKSGVFEHMTIVPNGKPCYCGNRGCLDAYCSTSALLEDGETLDAFFQELRTGSAAAKKRWLEYLRFLALAINNLHMFMDCPIILGGTIAKYLQGSDLKLLHQFVRNNTAFPTEREFIRVTCCPGSPISRGAALWFIKKYLCSIFGRDVIL